jgi:hypothetical protein
LNLIIWITNETVGIGQKKGLPIQSGSFYHQIELGKLTIIKQEKPYSDCLNELNTIDSYDSELFKRTLKSFKQRYHYSNCLSLCKQKNLGEKCNFQVNWWGPQYFENMLTETDYYSLLSAENNRSKCFQSNSNPTEKYLENCNCPLECQTDDNLNLKFKNQLRVFIFYDEMKETVISEEKKIEITDLISTIGGILGLFTGFSFLSLVEIVEIVFEITMILLKKDV